MLVFLNKEKCLASRQKETEEGFLPGELFYNRKYLMEQKKLSEKVLRKAEQSETYKNKNATFLDGCRENIEIIDSLLA